jgi:rubrerythrin
MGVTITTLAQFYVHALAIEREAVARYDEFTRYAEDHDRDELADVFRSLCRLERDHVRFIEKRFGPIEVPPLIAARYRWLEAGPTESQAAAHEWILRLIEPREALKVALEAERRAQIFYEQLAEEASDAEVRRFAREFAEEEAEHAARLERALAAEGDSHVDWERYFGADSEGG